MQRSNIPDDVNRSDSPWNVGDALVEPREDFIAPASEGDVTKSSLSARFA